MSGRAPLVASVVEGHGEVGALPVLLRRLAVLEEPWHVEIAKPFRQPRGKLLREGGLERAVEATGLRVRPRRGGVLVLLDADDDCPAEVGPKLLGRANAAAPGVPVAVVLANREYEAWFLAAASSLAGQVGLPEGLGDHPHPEGPRDAKGWMTEHLRRRYSETVVQATLSWHLDLDRARARSPSFDKLVRSFRALIG